MHKNRYTRNRAIQILGFTLIIPFFIIILNNSCNNISEDKTINQKQISINDVERKNKQALSYIETNPKLALKIIDTSMILIRKDKLIDAEIQALYIKGKCYRMLEKKSEAYTNITSSLQLSIDNNNNWYRILNLIELAEIQFRQLNFKEADSILNEAEYFALSNKYINCLSAIYNNKAKIADNSGEKVKAIKLYLKTSELFLEEKNEKSLAIVYNNLALLYRSINQNSLAISYLNKSKLINERNQYLAGLAENYNNLGVLFIALDSFEKSKEAYIKSRKIYEKMGRSADMAKSYLNIGNIFFQKNDFFNAEKYYDSSLFICKKHNIGYGIIINKINRGELFAKQGMHKKAVQLLKSELTKIKEMKMTDIEIEIESYLYKSYKSLGEYDSALIHFENYSSLIDSTSGLELKKQINELQNKYNKAEQEAEIIQLSVDIQKEKSKIRMIIITVLVILIIIIFVIFILILKNRKLLYHNDLQKIEYEKTRLKLELKNKELITNALHLASLTEFSNQFSDKVQEVINKQKDVDTKNSLSEILNEVNNVVPKGAWKDFETRFEQVHEGFNKKLFSDYPDLSSAELKICNFLRLNLTTKDIAILTHRSQRTIENQRNSIRKKMNLMTDSNLESHLIKNY